MRDSHAEKDALLPESGPPDDIYWRVVPTWCGESHDELDERLGEEYACGFAAAFEEEKFFVLALSFLTGGKGKEWQ